MAIAFKRIAKIMLLLAVFVSATATFTYLTLILLIRSEDTVVVPDVVGKEVVQTLERLSDLGLNTKVKGSEYSAEVPKRHVIYQDPEPGSEIKRGRDVRIVLSKGAQSVVLPNLVGLGLAQARILLEENDLGQGQISATYDATLPKEEILSQYPRPGFLGLRGDRVDLLVSAGSAPQIMPMADVRGLLFHQAMEIIEKLHLTSGAIRSIREAGEADDAIVDHQPAAGYPVVAGSTVAFSVNRDTATTVTGGQRKTMALFRHRTAPGFLKEHVRVRLNRSESTLELFDDFVKPDQEIWLLVPQEEPATLFLYVDDELIQTTHYE
jgi:serine/threonine-protein kinase